MVGVGRDMWRSPGPTPLFKRGHLEQVTQDQVRVAFDYLQGGRLHNISGKLVQLSVVGRIKCFSWNMEHILAKDSSHLQLLKN